MNFLFQHAFYYDGFHRSVQNYLNIYKNPYIIIFIPHRGTGKGMDAMPLFFFGSVKAERNK